jgi:hypothetical protein
MNIQKILFVIGCLSFFSCSKNKELYFSKERKEINIWLGTSTAPIDSSTYNFAYTVATHDSVMFNYRLAGYPLDHDTQFELQAVSGDTNRVYYSLGKYTIKAGAYQGTAPIYIDRPAGYSEFKNSTGKIVFKLKPSAVYTEGAPELSTLNVLFKNFVAKPDNWDVAPSGYFTMSKYFGTYSNVKYSFVIQNTGMVDFKIFYTVAKDPVLGPNTITATQASAFQAQCKVALQTYNTQHSTPLLDENNNPVVFP